MKTDGGREVEQRIVVAGKLPVDEFEFRIANDVGGNDVVVTAGDGFTHRYAADHFHTAPRERMQALVLLEMRLVGFGDICHIHAQAASRQGMHPSQ